jgi:hypothetical protein
MMWMPLLALALVQAAPAPPSPEAEALGKQVAETGTLAAVLPMIVAKDREQLVAEHPELSDADKTTLRASADAAAAAAIDRLLTAIGHGYARNLSVEDLRAVAAFNTSPAAKRWRAATPVALASAMGEVGDINLQQAALKDFCAKTGKLCK